MHKEVSGPMCISKYMHISRICISNWIINVFCSLLFCLGGGKHAISDLPFSSTHQEGTQTTYCKATLWAMSSQKRTCNGGRTIRTQFHNVPVNLPPPPSMPCISNARVQSYFVHTFVEVKQYSSTLGTKYSICFSCYAYHPGVYQ